MKKYIMFIPALVIFTSCSVVRNIHTNGEGKLPGNAHFIYTYTNSNLKPLDTLVLDGFVTDVNSYKSAKDQEYFTLQQFDSTKNTFVNRKILTEYIIYSKIKSLDNKDSLEYVYHARYGRRIVKRRNNLMLLYRSYNTVMNEIYDASIGTGGTRSEQNFDIKLLRDGKAIPDISFSGGYFKQTFIKFINKRYNQKFGKKDFKDVDEMTDYIMDMESKNTSNSAAVGVFH